MDIDTEEYSTNRRRGRFKILPIIIFLVVAIWYYSSNQETVPITGRSQLVDISREDEAMLGLSSYSQILSESKVINSGPIVEKIRSIGSKLALVAEDPGFKWEFNLIASPEINAFCLPGGKVAVYEGILPIAANDDGLAVIMGHEIAHAIARHGAERMAQQRIAQWGQLAVGMSVNEMDPQVQRSILGAFGVGTQFGILLPFSRTHESEADYMGLVFVARSCFNPQEAPNVWKRMTESSRRGQPPEFLSTHPSHETRIEQFNNWMPEALKIRSELCK